jgi:hypothetical protein
VALGNSGQSNLVVSRGQTKRRRAIATGIAMAAIAALDELREKGFA